MAKKWLKRKYSVKAPNGVVRGLRVKALMVGCNFQEILEKVFGSVPKMLAGKILPQCGGEKHCKW